MTAREILPGTFERNRGEMNHIIGLDPSLTATGIARYVPGAVEMPVIFHTVPAVKETGLQRVIAVRRETLRDIYPGCELVVIEGLSYGSNDPSAQERAFLHYSLREDLLHCGVRCVVCPPTTLKKFVTGSGAAKKDQMLLEVFKRWGYSAGNDNEADAIGLCIIGACILGHVQPTTQQQREVIEMLLNPKPKAKAKRARA